MDSALLRQRARERLSGNWAVSIAAAAVAALLGAMMAGRLFLPQLNIELDELREFEEWLEEGIRIGRTTIGLNGGVLGLAGFILGGVVQLGYCKFLLKQHDADALDWKDLFSEFDRFGQGFAQAFLRRLYSTLWGMLFLIPGIVKNLSYSMTPYIMAEDPNLTASEAIRRSMKMMDGHKAELFWLHLTFFGWDILAALTMGLGLLLLNPYKNAAETAFYRELKANYRPEY